MAVVQAMVRKSSAELMKIIMASFERAPKIGECRNFRVAGLRESPDPGIPTLWVIHQQRPVGPERGINTK